ncbi:MAG: cyclic nucleotide-binding domain-containing protein [Deltaproteobacteria bacterium]|nr:cyclic nucleotide-binding domain-containing protein [Deltaproteobacteria bacterium]
MTGHTISWKLEKGEIFGEMALIDDKPRSTSILTVTPCRLAFIRKDAFTEFIELRTDLSFRMMGYIWAHPSTGQGLR